ncbi:hypothetical protein KVC54_05730 [Helicobacter pylori]|nr:hypothetical protein KVC54_05730 [Helicobacter pylori]
MGSLSHIFLSILVVVLGLALVAMLLNRIKECVKACIKSFFTSLLAKFGLGKFVFGGFLSIPTLTAWIFGRSGFTAGEKFVIFCLGVLSLTCLIGTAYFGYGIITDFSALSAAMWWWSLSKITWFCVGYIVLWGLTLFMGFFTCSVIEDYS